MLLLDLDEPPGDCQAIAGRGQDVARGGHHRVGIPGIRGGWREGSAHRDQRVMGGEVGEPLEVAAGRRQISVEGVDPGPIDGEPCGLRPRRDGLDLGPQGPGLVEGREVAEDGQRPGAHQEDQNERQPTQEVPSPPPCATTPGALAMAGPGIVAHPLGTAMTMNRGDVGWSEVHVWRVSCSVGVGSRYWIAFHGTLGRTWVTTYVRSVSSTS